MNPCDYFLWGSIKEAVYFDRVETVEELQDRIEAAFAAVPREQVKRATQAMARRARACIQNNGMHFQQVVNKLFRRINIMNSSLSIIPYSLHII